MAEPLDLEPIKAQLAQAIADATDYYPIDEVSALIAEVERWRRATALLASDLDGEYGMDDGARVAEFVANAYERAGQGDG